MPQFPDHFGEELTNERVIVNDEHTVERVDVGLAGQAELSWDASVRPKESGMHVSQA
jgi:hypothetical protein